MRAIKFRAWDTVKKRYVNLEYEVLLVNPNGFGSYGDRYIWEQYTGLKDKNGKEIYEGDIVDKGYHNFNIFDERGVVEMNELCDSDGYCNGIILGWCAGKNSLLDVRSMCSVIGNVHENPELCGSEK